MKFHHILKLTQLQLFDYIACRFPWAIIQEGKYIYCPGNIPLMLVAHLDTVHTDPVTEICSSAGGNILMSPQGIGGDDRCGVWGLLKLYGQDIHPHLLFTCDEEVGGLGASWFATDFIDQELDLKFIIELDRKGRDEAVYYDSYCPLLEDYIMGLGYDTCMGSFSDISIISYDLNIPAVNLSIGYYNAHTVGEYINVSDMYSTINIVRRIIQEIDTLPKFVREEIQVRDDWYADWVYGFESAKENTRKQFGLGIKGIRSKNWDSLTAGR